MSVGRAHASPFTDYFHSQHDLVSTPINLSSVHVHPYTYTSMCSLLCLLHTYTHYTSSSQSGVSVDCEDIKFGCVSAGSVSDAKVLRERDTEVVVTHVLHT